MDAIEKQLKQIIKGNVSTSVADLETYSHDASLFEVIPHAVVAPVSVHDISEVVNFVSTNKMKDPSLSITVRSGGTDMSGAAIGESLILDMTKHFNRISNVSAKSGHAQPGVYYRNFEKQTLKHGALMPSYPASRELCTIGGMVANNSGGEKSLRYGKTLNYVHQLKAVLADGNEYMFGPLNEAALKQKLNQKDFEGELYRKVFRLVNSNYEEIKKAKPNVSKNSTGYNLWDVWDKDKKIFDMTKVLVGSQGTLGIITDIKFDLVPAEPYSGILVCFMKNTRKLGSVINTVLKHQPTSFESFDDNTLYLSLKFFLSFRKTLGFKGLIKLGLSLIPDAFILLRGIPKLILLVEFSSNNQEEIDRKIQELKTALKPYRMATEEEETIAKSKKYWIMRRESFNLLRQKVKDKHTAPFIDDFVVPPPELPKFLPKLRRIIKKYKLLATVAGHMGDGNFHIIPLMKIEEQSERAKLEPAMHEVNKLVLEHGGSLSGEHNDGLIRGPWLKQMYGKQVTGYFVQLKNIFDPKNIFNPHVKATSDWDYSEAHIRRKF